MPEPTESAVIRLLNEFRVLLDARDEAAMRELARRYLSVQAGVEADLTALALEMEQRRASGRVITEQMVWRDERFKKVRAQLQEQISRFNGDALYLIENGQEQNATLGIRAANEAIQATYIDAGAYGPAWNRLNINAIESMVGFAADGTPLSRLLKAAYPQALDGITQALVTGMGRGLGAAQVAKMMADGSAMGLERALLISRTELARSYRVASTKQYRESGVVGGFRRLVKKSTACLSCLLLDGQKFSMEEELSDHPRGKCVAVPDVLGVPPARWQFGRSYFRSLSSEEQRKLMGPEKYKLWEDGKINLDDLPRMTHSDEWGSSPRIATLKELTE